MRVDRPVRGAVDRDRTVGRAMQAVAVFGVVTALVLGVVAWRFLTDLDRTLDRSLAIGEDAAATLGETIDVADELLVALDDGLVTIGATLDGVATTTDDTADLAATTSRVAASLPRTFDDVDAALGAVERIGETIDGALRTASRLPLGPDYDPAVSLPEAVGGVRDALAPLGDDLDALATELDEFASGSGSLGDDLDGIRAEVDRTRDALAESDRVLDRYRDTAERAGALARTSRDDASRSIDVARLALFPLTVLVVVSQLVPWWLGSRLVRGRGALPVVDDRTLVEV